MQSKMCIRDRKMGSHEVYALDWELMLRSEQEVTEDITHVGIRGHWMRPADEAGENTMEVQVEEMCIRDRPCPCRRGRSGWTVFPRDF